jgi:NAD(P)-dependent dehydrogenase (short-subunit alcohol dehydrogenase family)
MDISGKAVLLTGGNRSIGRALVKEALKRDASRVHAAMRQPFRHSDERVTPVILDVTDTPDSGMCREGRISRPCHQQRSHQCEPRFERLLCARTAPGGQPVRPLGMTQAFLPLLTRSTGAIVNNLSMLALAPLPVTPAYAVSKAAAFNLTQSLRALLALRGVSVHAVLTGPPDTHMTRGLLMPKASPESVARAILDGVERDEEDIFPDSISAALADFWRERTAKALEREYAALVRNTAA